MTGRPQQVTDEEILHAVSETISAVGPHKLTVAAVAARVGVTAPAVHQRFGSGRDLLVAFAAHAAQFATASFDVAAGLAADPLDAVVNGLAACGSFSSRTEMANHLALLHLDLTDPQLREFATLHSHKLMAAARAQIAVAASSGQLTERCTVDELADLLYTTYNGALLTWALDGTGESHDWVVERLQRVLRPYRVA